jgi:pantoate--beta-alanine ligase
MKIFISITEIKNEITNLKTARKSIGFVPTMGALHAGHISLVKQCKNENDICVVSIFVNPTQFNDKEDLKNYPRTLVKDTTLLKDAGCDLVFAPSAEEMYPEEDKRVFDFGMLDKVMEGAHRSGHFNGVGQIITKLFDIVLPHRAYFGEKDFQQLAVIKKLVSDFKYPVEIIPCQIIREPDGLAMSSRNLLLTPEHRKAAPEISATLFRSQELAKSLSPLELKKFVTDEINKNPFLVVEYFDIVNDLTLISVKNWSETGGKQGCIAVKAGNVRLIDNVKYYC